MVINPLISPQPLISKGESRGLKFARVHVYVSVCVFCMCPISSIELHQLFNTNGSAIMFTHPAIYKACFVKYEHFVRCITLDSFLIILYSS